MRRGSSSLLLFTIFAEIAQVVEHNLAKLGVAGPSPVFRSFFSVLLKNKKHLLFMNLYLRYFDSEILVHTVDEAIEFLSSIEEIGMDANLEADVRQYANSDIYYPKRYKIRPRVYFIVIKTEAATMEDFKNKKAVRTPAERAEKPMVAPALVKLNEQRPGWYEGIVDFKRVLLVPGTGKFEYRDTRFVARCKADSGMDCYNRIIDNLRERVDPRSQFPSPKGKNFQFEYLGAF